MCDLLLFVCAFSVCVFMICVFRSCDICVCCSTRFLCVFAGMCHYVSGFFQGGYWCCGGDCATLFLCLAPDIVPSSLPFAPCFRPPFSFGLDVDSSDSPFLPCPLCVYCCRSVFFVCLSVFLSLSVSVCATPPSPSLPLTTFHRHPCLSRAVQSNNGRTDSCWRRRKA